MREQSGRGGEVFHAAANLDQRDEYGTLVLDGLGRIRSCGEAGERILGASEVCLVGRRISEFVSGLLLGESSPSYNARYLVYLCADGEWRSFQARDADGHGFLVELNLSRTASDGQEIFLLNLRRPETAPRP